MISVSVKHQFKTQAVQPWSYVKCYQCHFTFLNKIFSRSVLCRGLPFFCIAFSVPKHLLWAIKSKIWKNFKFFTIRGVPYGQKVTRCGKKSKKKFQKKNLKFWTKRNMKMGGISFNSTSGAFGGTLLCRCLWVYLAPYACGKECGIVYALATTSTRHVHCTCTAVMCSKMIALQLGIIHPRHKAG